MLPFPQLVIYGNTRPSYSGVLVMHSDNGFTDLAKPTRIINKSSTSLVTTTAQHLPGLTSSYNCNLGYIIIPATDMTDMNIGKSTGDFTVEWFCYITSVAGTPWYISSGTGTTSDVKVFSSTLYLQNRTGGSSVAVSTINNSTYVGRWIHCSLVQDGTTVTWYMNGTRILTAAGRWGDVNTPLRIGGYENVSNSYIDQIRITNLALYSGASFTAPDYPLV